MNEIAIYRALGDPVRWEIVRRLVAGSSISLGALSVDLGISRQGARKQVQVLVDAQVVALLPQGRQTHVTLNVSALVVAQQQLRNLESQWDQRLLALKQTLERNGDT